MTHSAGRERIWSPACRDEAARQRVPRSPVPGPRSQAETPSLCSGVSAVIPCFNEVGSIGATVEALRSQTRPPDEIVVVDGASTDGTLELLERLRTGRASGGVNLRGSGVPTPPGELPLGFVEASGSREPAQHGTRAWERIGVGAVNNGTPDEPPPMGSRLTVLVRQGASIPQAVNEGVRAATGEVIVRMDAHSTPAPDYIERALARLEEPRAGVVGGVWEIAPGARTTTASAIARAVAHPLGAGDAVYRIGRGETEPRDVETVPFGCFTRATWEALGGFDESLLTNEDYEFNHRVRARGLRVILDPAIRSTYYARSTLGALARQYFRYGWWKARMLRKHPASLRWRQAMPAGFVALLAGLAAAGLFWREVWWVLATVGTCYAAVLGLVAVLICAREGGWARLPALVGAFAVVHLAWGTGFVASAGGRARRP